MRAAIAVSISVALLLVLFVGLAGKPVPIGTFRGSRDLPIQPGTDPVVVEQMRRVVLKIAPDGKASLEDGGVPWEGQIRREGDRLRMEIDAIMDVNVGRADPSVSRELSFDVLPDGALRYGGVRLERR